MNLENKSQAVPAVVLRPGVDPAISVDANSIATTMREHHGIGEGAITSTTVIIDDKNGLSYKGSQTPKWLDRAVRGKTEENEGKGSIVRVSTRSKGKLREPGAINATLSHELEHVAQQDRKDKSVVLGNALIWGGALAGAISGNLLARNKSIVTRIGATALGFMVGQQAGYKVAPHEIQARARAKSTPMEAIKSNRLN